jgi:RimJ/RimL family protein N-acetyltransferase
MRPLANGKFILRTLRVSDAKSLLDLIDRNRKRISNYFPRTSRLVHDLDSSKSYIRDKIKNAKGRVEYFFILESIDGGRFSGMLFLKNFDWTVPKCELGYFIDAEQEGKGITSEAIGEATGFCFNELKLNKIFIRAAINNIGSKRVAEKNGFVEEGVMRKDFMTESGELIDVVYYGLVKDQE